MHIQPALIQGYVCGQMIASDERIGRDTPLDITTSPAVSQEGEMIKIAARRAYERMGQQD